MKIKRVGMSITTTTKIRSFYNLYIRLSLFDLRHFLLCGMQIKMHKINVILNRKKNPLKLNTAVLKFK